MHIRFLHFVTVLLLLIAGSTVGCEDSTTSAPTGNQFEQFAKDNPGVLVPANDLEDYEEEGEDE